MENKTKTKRPPRKRRSLSVAERKKQLHLRIGLSLAGIFLVFFLFLAPFGPHLLFGKGRAVNLSDSVLQYQALVVTIYIAADFSLSFKAALDIKDLLAKMTAAKEEMDKVQTRLDAIIAFTGQTAAFKTLSNSKDRLSGTLQSVKAKLDFLQKHEHSEERRSGKQLTAFREELEQLKTKYIVDNEYRKALSNRLGFFRKELLKAHPTIASPKFESALAELKEIVSEKSHKED